MKSYKAYPKSIKASSRLSEDAKYAAGALGQFLDNIHPDWEEHVTEEELHILEKAENILRKYYGGII